MSSVICGFFLVGYNNAARLLGILLSHGLIGIFSLVGWATLVGIPIPELCFTAHTKGYAAERVAEAYAMQLVNLKIMDVNFNLCDAPPYRNALKSVVALMEKDGGYRTPSTSIDILRRVTKENQWGLLPILDDQEGHGLNTIYMCIWKLTMRYHDKREY